MHIVASNETIVLVIKFRIGGSLRFLSHAETVRVFQRACTRAGIEIQHSQGYNPHPKLSLPLPRPVGVESEDELLCLRVGKSTSAQEQKSTSDLCASIEKRLSEQLPEGIELLSVDVAESNTSFHPCLVTYVLPIKQTCPERELSTRIEQSLARENLIVERHKKTKISDFKSQNSNFRCVDVRPFLESIKLDDSCIIVECKYTNAGSIRVEEILKLLEIDVENLTGPIRRTKVKFVSREA